MITFTPLSGAARSSRTIPLAYLLQVDDVRILLDCGSPDWCPEAKEEEWSEGKEVSYGWEEYCRVLRENAPSIDLVLLSHGDLAHSGLYAYAYARWGLTAPAYTTLPVQAMARVACTEDVEGVREQEAFDDDPSSSSSSETEEEHEQDHGGVEEKEGAEAADVKMEQQDGEEKSAIPSSSGGSRKKEKRKYVATVQEVHEAFDSITVLRYSQPCHLQGKCQGLTIIPFNAGHTLGGTIWKIRSPTAGTILYAVDMNHMRERHLDGTVLMRQGSNATVFETLQRPDLLITDAERANVTTARRKDRDAALLDCVSATLSSRNSVLMPCDASSRVLELLVLLDQHWKYSRLRYPICLLSKTAHEMLTFVRSMMEWLGGTISKEDVGADGQDGGNKGGRGQKRKRDDDNDDEALGAFALRFPFLEIFPNPAALTQRYASGDPKLILAIPASLSHGASRAIFADFAQQENSVVLLTGRGEEGTLGRQLFEQWDHRQREEYKWDRGKIGTNVMMDGVLHLKMNSKEPLQGAELEEYLARERAEKEKQAAKKAAEERRQRILEADEADTEDDDSDSDSDDDDDENEVERALGDDGMNVDGETASPQLQTKRRDAKRGGGGSGKAAWSSALEDDGVAKQMLSYDIYLKGNVSKATSFFKSADGQTQRFRMFPYVEKKRRVDEYGELLDVEMWLRKGKALEVEGESEEMKEMKKVKAEEELKKTPQEPPSKFVTSVAEVQLACRLLFVDLEGLNDGRAVKTIVAQVNPRKMIVVHAPAAATDHLLESCAGIRAMTKDIYAPAQGECIQIGQHTNSFSVSLSDELLASLKMSRFEDNEVGHVTGRIASIATSTIPILEPITSASLKASPSATSSAVQKRGKMLGARPTLSLPQSTLIGELKLTALKTRLAAVGVQAELIGEGVLICGAAAKGRRGAVPETLEDSVAVKKTARGKVELEGPVSDVYYVVRREVYGLHAVVAA